MLVTNFGFVMTSVRASTILLAVSSSHFNERPRAEFSTNKAFLHWSPKNGEDEEWRGVEDGLLKAKEGTVGDEHFLVVVSCVVMAR